MKGPTQRLAVVTGGIGGIGLAIARRLVADGFGVVAAAPSGGAELPWGVDFAPLDVTDRAAVEALFAGLSRLDLLVNNAGVAAAPDSGADDALWHAVLATSLTGAWYCSRAALARLPDRTGRIVNVSSVFGAADEPAHGAARLGLVGLTRAMAVHAASRGITVNAVCPGWMDPDTAAGVPAGRAASPFEVADTVAFLARAGAGGITGQAIAIGGGASMRAAGHG
jgi:NAD(P)-dependent dehydrogenase (short-subunit alcohol dehydrogenase family)